MYYNNNNNYNKKDEAVTIISSARNHHWGKYWGTATTNTSTNNYNYNNNNNNGSTHTTRSTTNGNKRPICCRFMLLLIVLFVAVTVGYTSYHFMSKVEENLANKQYNSISKHALIDIEKNINNVISAGKIMSTIISKMYMNNNIIEEEFIEFEKIAQQLLYGTTTTTTTTTTMSLVTFINNNNNTQDLHWRTITTTSTSSSNDEMYNNNNNNNNRNTTTQHHYSEQQTLLSNNIAIADRMINCTLQKKQQQQQQEYHNDEYYDEIIPNNNNNTPSSCGGTITNIFVPNNDNGRLGTVVLSPIYPLHNPFTIVGFIPIHFVLDELLMNVFPDEVNGINIVFQSSSSQQDSYTYTIKNGIPQHVESTSSGENNYQHTEHSKDVLIDDEDLTNFIRISIYPNNNGDFYNVYKTRNPIGATICSICIIILTSLIFFIYDTCVRRQFNQKKELLDARRQFLRFVSHEVRTPLNSVSMGLDLLQDEIAIALGYNSATSLRAHNNFNDNNNNDNHENNNNKIDSTRAVSKTHSSVVDVAKTSNTLLPNISTNRTTKNNALDWFQLAHEIQSNTQGAVDILNDLLNYDKIEQGNLQLSLELISVWDLIEKAILEFKLPASSKKINLGTRFCFQDATTGNQECFFRPCDLPVEVRQFRVVGDPIRLIQVLRNLASNALKFTPDGGSVKFKTVFVQERITTNKTEEILLNDGQTIIATCVGYIEITVTDSGAGMSQDQLSKLFSDGVQFNANELQAGQGSGLGLFIAKGIVKQHHGELSATSKGLNYGTSFILKLPLWVCPEDIKKLEKKAEIASPPTVARTLSSRSSIGGQVSLRVLVVDDVLSNRKLLRRLLVNAGHTCDEAADGHEAVEKVKQAISNGNEYDSVLMDYEMPELSGPLAAKQIREMGCNVFIAGVTGNVLPEDVAYFRSCGANDVLSKPVKVSHLDELWESSGVYIRCRQ